MTEDIDITKAAEDLANEKLEQQKAEDTEKDDKKKADKVTDLESQLAEYQKKEEEQKLAEEEKKKSEISKRLEAVEKGRADDKLEYETKLEKLSTRQTSGKVSKVDAKKALSREDYDKNKDEYNSMLVREVLEKGKL